MSSKTWSRSVSAVAVAAVLAGCGTAGNAALFAKATAGKGVAADAFTQLRTVVRIHFTDRDQLVALERAGVDLFENVNSDNGTVGATLTAKTEAALKQMGVKYDLLQTAEKRTKSGMPSGYKTVDQVYADMKAIAAAHPDIAKQVEIGKSLEGRSLFALEITSKPGQGLPAIRINSGQHARELPPVELTDNLMHLLTDGYGKDAKISTLVDSRDIWIVPIVNPDGRTKVQQGNDMWRKNTRKLAGGAYGVDTNRNCDDHFDGGDDDTWADDYQGPAPFSEPESSAIRDLCGRMHFKTSLDLHNYAGMILWPPGYTSATSKDEPTFRQIGGTMGSHVHYKAGTIANTIYKTWGDLSTWEYDKYNTLAFAAELNDSGFDAAHSEADRDWNLWKDNFLYLIDATGNVNAKHPDQQSLMPIPTI